MKHRLPSFLLSFWTTMLAIFATVLAPQPAAAEPATEMFTPAGQTPDGRPIVEVHPGASMNALVQRYAALYKSTTGEELTWQVIYAANPKQIIPNCINPAPGKPHWLGRGNESVWENCAEKDKTAGLVAGASAHITIPLAHVETYEERQSRIEGEHNCLLDPVCLQERLTALGVTPQQAPPPDEDPLAQKLVEHEMMISTLMSTNDSLTERNNTLMAANAVLTTQVENPPSNDKTSRSPWEPAFALVIGLGLVVGTSNYAYRRGKKNGQKAAESVTALVTASPTSVKVVSTQDVAYARLDDSHKSLTGEYNKRVAEITALKARVAELETENAGLRAQPRLAQQYNINAEHVTINNATPPRAERETKPDIKTPAAPPAPTTTDRASDIPMLPSVRLPVMDLVSMSAEELAKTRNKVARRVVEHVDAGRFTEAQADQQFVDKVDRALAILNAKEKIPPLELPPPAPTRDSVPDRDSVSDRITVPELRGHANPHASLKEAEAEIAALKVEVERRTTAHGRFVKRVRRYVADMRGRNAGMQFRLREIEYDRPLEYEALSRMFRRQWCTDSLETEAIFSVELERQRACEAEHKTRHVRETLEKTLCIERSLNALRQSHLEEYILELADVLVETHENLRTHTSDLNAANARLESIDVNRSQLNTLWPQIQDMSSEVDATASQGQDVSTQRQILDAHIAEASPLFKELTGLDLFEVMTIVVPSAVNAPPPSDRAFQKSVSIRPKVPSFDPEVTVVADAANYPPRNGKGQGYAHANPMTVSTNGGTEHDLPSGDELAEELKYTKLLDALGRDNLPQKFAMTRRAVDRMKRFFMLPTVYADDLLERQSPDVKLELGKKTQPLITAMNELAMHGVFTPDTLFPRPEHTGLPSSPGGTYKNGA